MFHFKQIKKIIRSSGIYTALSIFNRAVSFLLLPVLTRLLSPLHYGILATFQAIYPMGESFIDMGSNTAISRQYFDKDEKEPLSFAQYIFNATVVKLLFLMLFSVLLFLLRNLLVKEFNFPFWLVSVIPCVAFCGAFIGTVRALFIVQKKPYAYSLLQGTRTIINILLSLLLVIVIGMGWKGRVSGITATEVIFFVACLAYLLRKNLLSCKLKPDLIKKMLLFGMPLFAYGIGRWVINLTDRFFLNTMLDVSVTGVYSVGYSVASIVEFIAGAVGLAVMPVLFEKLKNPTELQKSLIVRYTYFYFLFMLIITLVWIFISPYFMKIFIGKSFMQAAKYIPLISLAYFANAIFRMFSWYVAYSKKTYYLTYAVIIAAVINLILNYFLIKLNGAIGAAQSTLISYLVNTALVWYFAQKVYPMPWFSFIRKNHV